MPSDAAKGRPGDLDLVFSLGVANERLGRHAEAEDAFQRALAIDPEDGRTLNYLGYMWADRGEKLEQALELIQRAVALEPDNGAYVDSLGWVYFRLGRLSEARHHLEEAARLVPEDATILEHLGDLYVALEIPGQGARDLPARPGHGRRQRRGPAAQVGPARDRLVAGSPDRHPRALRVPVRARRGRLRDVRSCIGAGFERALGDQPRRGSCPPAELDSQRLMRVRLTSDEGRGRFRLLLRLHDPARYQIRATHPLFNQRLWTLDVDGDRAVLVDFHQHVVCRYQGAAEIGAIPLGPFPFESLPALLLGYLPLPPAQPPERPAPGLLVVHRLDWGAGGPRLSIGDLVERFEVAGDETVTWERSDDGWYVLAAAAENLDLRWKETLREPLGEPLAPIEVPAGYAEGPCDLGWLTRSKMRRSTSERRPGRDRRNDLYADRLTVHRFDP